MKKKNFSKWFAISTIALAVVTSCKKDDNNDNPTPPPPVEKPKTSFIKGVVLNQEEARKHGFMVLQTDLNKLENWSLYIKADDEEGDENNVWIDLNNNGSQDEGERTLNPKRPTSEIFTIYGKVTLLNCQGNFIKAIDISGNKALYDLGCSYNQLTELDISNNKALRELKCYNNRLSELDVSNCTALKTLECQINKLTELDVSNNINLELLKCYGNPIKGDKMVRFLDRLPIIKKGNSRLELLTAGSPLPSLSHIKAANDKGWRLFKLSDSGFEEIKP